MPIGWGGVVAGVGLTALAGGTDPVRIAIMGVLALLSGFLAGVRAEDRRVLHAALGAVAGHAFYAAFVLIAWAIDGLGGPEHPPFAPGGWDRWWILSLSVLGAAMVGGMLAAYRLRPQGRPPR